MDHTPDQPKPAPEPSAADPQHLVLAKESHRWVIRYRCGEETDVLRTLADAANDPTTELDWFDAAVLSHQMGGKMQQQLKKLISG